MKIGILTFHASHNYGSMLQAWALQHYLNTHGHDAETINLRIKAQREMYNFPLRPVKKKILYYCYSLFHPLWLYHACRKWIKYERFLNDNLRLTDRTYNSWEDIVSDLPSLGYQCLITGGDQIWNMNCKDFDKSYFLPSKLSDIKKISYSPSSGNFLSKITKEQEAFVKDTLSDYSYISVRETSMQEYLGNLLNKDITLACDPTLLLKSENYFKFLDEMPIVSGPYIFYYSPGIKSKCENLAIKIGRHYGMKVVTCFPRLRGRNRMYTVPESGPAEFLNLLKNATLVIGKSFHLVVFSLLFHKDFIAIEGDTDARMISILTKLGIQERGQVNEGNYQTKVLPPIDFEKVDRILQKERTRSQQFLDEALCK